MKQEFHYHQEGSFSYLLSIVLVTVVGGLLFGYDTAVISGAEQSLQDFFENAKDFTYTGVMHGFTASSALIGCILGSAVSGLLASRMGRRNSLRLAAVGKKDRIPGIRVKGNELFLSEGAAAGPQVKN